MGTGSFHHCFAQNVGVGTNTPHTSAILDVQSTTKGASLPTMTTAQRKAITGAKVGLLVFDIDKNTIFMFDGVQWQALVFSSSEGAWPPIERTASDGAGGDFLGRSVSISGDYAVIGAPNADVGADVNCGAAYVFFRSGSVWSQQAKLVAADNEDSDNFGFSVSISGDYIIVGAFTDDGAAIDQGSAYIFVRSGTTWTQQDQVFASNASAQDRFGYSVGISGDYAIVGAPMDDVNANADQGSAYFFVRSGNNWTQQEQVIGPFTDAGDFFGFSVAMQGDNAIIGAPRDDVGGNNREGSAHVFVRLGSDWSHQGTLTAFSGAADDELGESVSIYGDWAVAGAPNYGGGANADVGAVYVFHRTGTTWGTGNFITLYFYDVPSNADDRFGTSVSITNDHLLVGAAGANVGLNAAQGNAYLFRRENSTWRFTRVITDANGTNPDQAGSSVGIDGFNCIIGALGALNNKGKILFVNVE